ncbi:MAG: Clp1/GlmU family protein [Pyrobaculum sp.]
MFTIEVPPGHVALVRGPAEVRCEESCVVFGGRFSQLQVPPYRQYPVEGPTVVRLEGGVVELTRGPATPQDWQIDVAGVVALVGPVDSGKSGLSTFLLNRYHERKVCIIDADVGQSDVGPPGLVSYSCATEPTVHISELTPRGGYYIGSATPQGVEELLLAGVMYCLKRVAGERPYLTVINTPGWTSGRGIQLLKALTDATGAYVINIGEAVLRGLVVSKPRHVASRSLEERRLWRNYSYRKHVALRYKMVASYDLLTLCTWDRGLTCPWARYQPGDRPERKERLYSVYPQYLRNLFAVLYKGGELAGYGVVERLEPQLALYTSTEDFDEVKIGKTRVNPETLEELDPLP